MVFFEYKVNFLPSDSTEIAEERGLVSASNYVEAINKLMEYFGEENIIDIYLQAWDTCDCLSLDEIKEGFELT